MSIYQPLGGCISKQLKFVDKLYILNRIGRII